MRLLGGAVAYSHSQAAAARRMATLGLAVGHALQHGSCKDTAGDRLPAERARSGMGDVGVPGVENTAGLARFIDDNGLPGAGADLTVELIAGGRSNLTYRLEFRAPGGTGPDAPV